METERNKIQEQVAKHWGARGFSCDLGEDPTGEEWTEFLHPQDELVMLIEGSVELEIDGEFYQPKVGEEILIPGGRTHSVRTFGKKRSVWLYGYKQND